MIQWRPHRPNFWALWGYHSTNSREQPQQSFGDWLRRQRRALDLTQEQLARQVGCSTITLRKLEAEERRPSRQIVERLAHILGVAPDDRPALLRFARGDPFATPADAKIPDQSLQQHAQRHNLPLQLTSFIGRENEIAEINHLLSQSGGARLLTLTGAGGSGKTRLALQVAAALLDDFPDGVWLVELAPLADSALVPQSVAGVLGLREMPGRPLIDLLVDNLRTKRLLLVLDNCEHLIQPCAELAEHLLRSCPHLSILATSREPLGIGGEAVYGVPSLSLPDSRQPSAVEALSQFEAVRLFVERAGTALPGFKLTNANAPALAEVCQQLGGIPLAIELAATRVKVLRVEEIAARLSDRFGLLTGGSRTALPRHQTLAALVDWSYDLLSEPERNLLRRVSVFAGGWTLAAAEDVCADEALAAGMVLDLLTQLANKSLILAERAPGQATRYRLLETIRQFALAKLSASGEADVVRRQHAMYYLAQVATMWNRSPQTIHVSLERMDTEHGNFRAALDWSQSATGSPELGLSLVKALAGFWYAYGYWSEARSWIARALAWAEGMGQIRDRAELLRLLGDYLSLQGDYLAAQTRLNQSLKLFQGLGDPRRSAFMLDRLGLLAREQGDVVTARARLEESLALSRELGDEAAIGGTLNTLGEVAVMQEDPAWATTLLEEALAVNRESRELSNIGWSLNHLGHVAQLQGENGRAIQLHLESLTQFHQAGWQTGGFAEAYAALGHTALA